MHDSQFGAARTIPFSPTLPGDFQATIGGSLSGSTAGDNDLDKESQKTMTRENLRKLHLCARLNLYLILARLCGKMRVEARALGGVSQDTDRTHT